MSFDVNGSNNQEFPTKSILIACVLFIAIFTASSAFAANVGFSGTVFANADRALMPQNDRIVTFTNQFGVRLHSQNIYNAPVKLKLTVRDSNGNRVRPVSISGRSIVKPKQKNPITLILPMERVGRAVFELCMQQMTRNKKVVQTSCSKVLVSRYQ